MSWDPGRGSDTRSCEDTWTWPVGKGPVGKDLGPEDWVWPVVLDLPGPFE